MSHTREELQDKWVRTHETLLPRLVAYSLDLTDVVECHAIFAEQPTMDDKVAFLALR